MPIDRGQDLAGDGNVPLGYVVKNRRLAVTEPEAAIVRSIFEHFIRAGAVIR